MKIQAIVNMHVPQNSLQIQVLNGMAQFNKSFIKNFIVLMALITKLAWKIILFLWIEECWKS
jgi:hypothetical protein